MLDNPSSKEPSSIVTFEFTSLVTNVNAQERELFQAVHAANENVERINITHAMDNVAERVNNTAEQVTMFDVLKPLIDKVKVLAEVCNSTRLSTSSINCFIQSHPYAKAASTALLAIPKVCFFLAPRQQHVS